MSDLDGAVPPLPRGRGCRFSCRTLLLVVAAIAVCLGIGVRPWQRHRVLQTIRRELNGGVVYTYEYRPTEHGWSTSAEAGPGPTWLRHSLGEPLFDDLFCDVPVSSLVTSPFMPAAPRLPRMTVLPLTTRT